MEDPAPDDYICCLYADVEDDRMCLPKQHLFNMASEKGYLICSGGVLLIMIVVVIVAFTI